MFMLACMAFTGGASFSGGGHLRRLDFYGGNELSNIVLNGRSGPSENINICKVDFWVFICFAVNH